VAVLSVFGCRSLRHEDAFVVYSIALTAPSPPEPFRGRTVLTWAWLMGAGELGFLTPPGFGSAGYSRAHVGGRINLINWLPRERDSLGLSYGPKNLYC